MPTLRKILALVLAAAPLAASNVWAFGTTERVEVPIRQLTLPDGMIRYSVPVSIGGNPPIDAMLDTGSFGLRVLVRAVSPNQYTPTENQRSYRFESGVRLRGMIATAVVSVGAATTGTPIPIQVIQSVDCVKSKPSCRHPNCNQRITASGAMASQGRVSERSLDYRCALLKSRWVAQPIECLRPPQLDSNPATT